MKAEELRIGNYVSDNLGGTLKIKAIGTDPVLNHIKPIRITEDWLLKLGFKKQMAWTFSIHINGRNDLVYYLGEKGWSINHKSHSDFDCVNVHQLQNLYFSLTGKELTKSPMDNTEQINVTDWLVSILNKPGYEQVLTDEEIEQVKAIEEQHGIKLIQHIIQNEELRNYSSISSETAKHYLNQFNNKQ